MTGERRYERRLDSRIGTGARSSRCQGKRNGGRGRSGSRCRLEVIHDSRELRGNDLLPADLCWRGRCFRGHHEPSSQLRSPRTGYRGAVHEHLQVRHLGALRSGQMEVRRRRFGREQSLPIPGLSLVRVRSLAHSLRARCRGQSHFWRSRRTERGRAVGAYCAGGNSSTFRLGGGSRRRTGTHLFPDHDAADD